jgi:hypothetical protein
MPASAFLSEPYARPGVAESMAVSSQKPWPPGERFNPLVAAALVLLTALAYLLAMFMMLGPV